MIRVSQMSLVTAILAEIDRQAKESGQSTRLAEMADVSPVWAKLVADLTAVYLAELPTGRAPKLYDRMKALGC